MSKFNLTSNIRNFAIISHIDHGKTTLTDRLLEKTNFKKGEKLERILDSLLAEKKKGITIKLNVVQLIYNYSKNSCFFLNLIDTPGHIDFMYEVTCSLSVCEGVILLVDVSKGIQAQTLTYLEIARKLNLKIIPVINKIDLFPFKIPLLKKQIKEIIGCSEEEICLISAKMDLNINQLLQKIVTEIPAPKFYIGSLEGKIFDLLYNRFFGLIVFIRVIKGKIIKKQKIKFNNNNRIYQVERIGVKNPNEILKEQLETGEIGWFTAKIHETQEIKIGDIVLDGKDNSLFKSFNIQKIKHTVFFNFFPVNDLEYKKLKKILKELTTQDSSLLVENTESQLLGPGFFCGFFGLLHQEIIQLRIEEECNLKLIVTPPKINYLITYQSGEKIETSNPQKICSKKKIKTIEEILILLFITTPEEYLGEITELCRKKRGILQKQQKEVSNLWKITYNFPLSEFISGFHNKLKHVSHGYASFDYEIIGFFPSDIVKVDILLNSQLIGDLSFFVYRTFAYKRAKEFCIYLKETLSKQNFSISIQACIGKKIISRETIEAKKKNVVGNLYGGDRTRKIKLWEKQKKGKKKMKRLGKITFDKENLRKVLFNIQKNKKD